jgi:hypothetical protein
MPRVCGSSASTAARTRPANSRARAAHTVRDHVKAIFQKVGVSSRGGLVAKLFAEYYEPVHLRGDVVHVDTN